MSSCHNKIARYIYTWMGIWIMKGYVQDSPGMMLVGKGRQKTHWRNKISTYLNYKLYSLELEQRTPNCMFWFCYVLFPIFYAYGCFSEPGKFKHYTIGIGIIQQETGIWVQDQSEAAQPGAAPHNGWSLNYPCLVGISFYSESFSWNLGLHHYIMPAVKMFNNASPWATKIL